MKIKFLVFAFSTWLMSLSCQKEVTILLPNSKTGEQVFIECVLFPGYLPQAYLSLSKPFFDSKVIPQQVFIRGASVMIISDIGSDILKPDSTFDQFRCRYEPYYRGNSKIEKDKSYQLQVVYNGNTYTATCNTNQARVRIDSVRYTPEFFDVYGGHDGVIIKLRDTPGQKNFYRFQMNRMIDTSRHHAHILDKLIGKNNCTQGEEFLVKDYGRIIFNDEGNDGNELVMPIEVSWEYEKGDTGWIFIQSLDQPTAKFYSQLDDQLQSILNPFVEPVLINSQIKGAFGVFGSAVLSDSVLFIYPQDHP